MDIDNPLFIGTLQLRDKTFWGPVTSVDNTTYVWVNRSSGEDYYFYLIKHDSAWIQAEGGQEILYPQQAVDSIGSQIDLFLSENGS